MAWHESAGPTVAAPLKLRSLTKPVRHSRTGARAWLLVRSPAARGFLMLQNRLQTSAARLVSNQQHHQEVKPSSRVQPHYWTFKQQEPYCGLDETSRTSVNLGRTECKMSTGRSESLKGYPTAATLLSAAEICINVRQTSKRSRGALSARLIDVNSRYISLAGRAWVQLPRNCGS